MVSAKPLHELDQFGETATQGTADAAQAEAREVRRIALRQRLAHAWIPIRQLRARHRQQILDHLIQLDDHDRYLRFGFQAPLEQLSRYTASINFKRDEVYGIFNTRLKLMAVAHLADLGDLQHPAGEAGHAMEFGVSVLPSARGLGLGQRLFEHAIQHARNRHAKALVIHALTENRPMLKIAQRAGARLESTGADSEAWLSLPPDSLATHLGGWAQDWGAEAVFRMRAQGLRVRDWIRRLFSMG